MWVLPKAGNPFSASVEPFESEYRSGLLRTYRLDNYNYCLGLIEPCSSSVVQWTHEERWSISLLDRYNIDIISDCRDLKSDSSGHLFFERCDAGERCSSVTVSSS